MSEKYWKELLELFNEMPDLKPIHKELFQNIEMIVKANELHKELEELNKTLTELNK